MWRCPAVARATAGVMSIYASACPDAPAHPSAAQRVCGGEHAGLMISGGIDDT